MKKLLYLFIFFSFVLFANAQTQQALLNRTKHWRFGHKAGLDFNTITGVPTVFNGSNGVVYEGNSCISDTLGNLLFYCSGDTVWNKNHQMMLNGAGMKSDKITILNSCIIPKPGNANQYFLFVNECINNNCGGGKLFYSLIDMTLDGGNGAVVLGQKNIQLSLDAYPYLAFTKHGNGTDYWLAYSEYIIPPVNQTQIIFIKITSTGPDVTNRIISGYEDAGFSRFSPNGQLFATTGYKVYQFDKNTGTLSNQINLPTDSLFSNAGYSPFSLAFSSNSNMLYYPLYQTSIYNNLIQQFNLTTYSQPAISASMYSFFDSQNYFSFRGFGHCQLGLNGKIYIARTGGFIDSLHVIHNPNLSGALCNFQFNAINLNNKACNFSLPIFPDYFFNNIPGVITNLDKQTFYNLKIILYPNPCNNELNIKHSITNNYSYKIINQLGKITYEGRGEFLQNKINTSQLPDGMYYLIVSSSFGNQTHKIIINH
ncbi:MAG: T9SS type A sorting domain-containing protein [Bacteroidota bacterium]